MLNTDSALIESTRDDLCKGKRVIICEDHPATRLGFRATCLNMGCEVVAETDRGAEAIELVESYKPDLLILDQYLRDDVEGQEVHRAIRQRDPLIKIFVITSFCDSASFFDWINQPDGPDAVLEKTSSLYQLRMAIAQVLLTGVKYIPDSVWNKEQSGAQNPLSKLAPHELRVLRDVARGFKLIQIAKRRNLTANTVHSYMNDIYYKLELPTHTLQAAAFAYNKWISAGSATAIRAMLETD